MMFSTKRVLSHSKFIAWLSNQERRWLSYRREAKPVPAVWFLDSVFVNVTPLEKFKPYLWRQNWVFLTRPWEVFHIIFKGLLYLVKFLTLFIQPISYLCVCNYKFQRASFQLGGGHLIIFWQLTAKLLWAFWSRGNTFFAQVNVSDPGVFSGLPLDLSFSGINKLT